MVKSWILNSVAKQIYGSILCFIDASAIWKDLTSKFHITNFPRSYQLTQQIWSIQQGNTDLSTYYTKLKTLWDDLDGADCIKTCQNCNCCKANATKIEHSKIIKFLAGLNESYANGCSQIIMKKNVPPLREVYNLLDHDFSSECYCLSHDCNREHSTFDQCFLQRSEATSYVFPLWLYRSHCG